MTASAASYSADELVRIHAEVGQIVENARPDDVRHGWRWFVVHHRTGALYSPFDVVTQPGEGPGFTGAWTRAQCRPDKAPAHFWGRRAFDLEDHLIPGRRCGCGWRIYPSIAAATVGAEEWPDRPDIHLDLADAVLAGVEYCGKLVERPSVRGRTADETGTLRAEWLRVAGPIYVAPQVARPARRGLSRRYRLRAGQVIKLDQVVFDALLDGEITDHCRADIDVIGADRA